MKQRKFVGLDVHKESIAMVVIDEQGLILMESIIATEAQTIGDFVRGLSGEIHLTFEVGTQSTWLYHQVKPLVEKVVVCNSRHNKLLQVGNKADLIDAKKLAELLRLGAVKEVWQHSVEQIQLKELVRTYENLLSDAIRVMNRVKAIYRGQAIKCQGVAVYQPTKRGEWLAKVVDEGLRFRAQMLLLELDSLIGLRKQAKQEMLKKAQKHPDFKRLCQIPGLGLMNVARLLGRVGTPFRFSSKRQFWKYCGFAVTTRSSADHVLVEGKLQKRIKQTSTRGLTRHFCHQLKNVFKMAANKASRSPAFAGYYENLLDKGVKPALARVSLARKIAAITLSMWKNETDFINSEMTATK